MTVGQKIRKIRKEKGYTQKQLGKMAGIAEITIRQYEAEKYNPKLDAIRKISTALGVCMSDLMDGWGQYSLDEIRNDFINTGKTVDSKNFERMEDLFFKLNEKGQEKALDQVELLTKVSEYQADISSSGKVVLELNENGNFNESEHLKAAHNDNADDAEEQRLMAEDLKDMEENW